MFKRNAAVTAQWWRVPFRNGEQGGMIATGREISAALTAASARMRRGMIARRDGVPHIGSRCASAAAAQGRKGGMHMG